MDRSDLMADLTQAVLPESARSVLVVFGFAGLKDHLETLSQSEGDILLERLAVRLRQTVRSPGKVYEPRRGEFCSLVEGELGSGWPMVPAALDEETSMLGLRTSFTLVTLPSEASTPGKALVLADQRLRAQSGNLRPQPRT